MTKWERKRRKCWITYLKLVFHLMCFTRTNEATTKRPVAVKLPNARFDDGGPKCPFAFAFTTGDEYMHMSSSRPKSSLGNTCLQDNQDPYGRRAAAIHKKSSLGNTRYDVQCQKPLNGEARSRTEGESRLCCLNWNWYTRLNQNFRLTHGSSRDPAPPPRPAPSRSNERERWRWQKESEVRLV